MTERLRSALIETALEMNRSGINQGRAGNLSVRHEGGMLITPSGMAYSGLQPEDIAFVDSDGGQHGPFAPSSEWRIHHDIYRAREDVSAVLHAHPAHATSLACMHRPIPAFHYMVAVAGGKDIPCAPYETFGTGDLSAGVLHTLQGRNACLMANHGMICLAGDLGSALDLAVEVEHLARTYLKCLSVGEPALLDDEEMERVLEKFQGYRQG